MRTLDFKSSHKPEQVYETLYDGIVNTPRGFEGPSENRTIGRVLDKLEAIGKPCKRNGQDVYEYIPDSAPVSLEEAEYNLMMEALKVIKFRGEFSRLAGKMFDWLASSPTERT